MRISHAGKLPANEAIVKAAPTAAMKRSVPMRTRFKGSLSTRAPARIPNKAIGRKPASDAKERREDDPVVRARCQIRPIWRIELVNVETSSPPHTKQSLNCHEWHSRADLRREVSNIMVMSNRGMACKTARRHNSAAFRRSSTCGKDQPRHPSFVNSVWQTM